MRFLIETKVRKDLKDLTGQKFGDLTILEYDKEKSRATGQTYWKCKCSCGKETSVARKHLLNGDIKSCGHTKRQNGLDHYEDNFKGMRDRQNKYHTNLEIIRNQKMQPNNTSGVKGVDYHKGRDMWRARVRVNGKELTKWSKDKDVAIKWRQDAIDKYYKPQIDKAIKAGDLKESKADQQAFIDYFGKELVDKFYMYQNRLPKDKRDLYYWKKFSPAKLESELYTYETTPSASQERRNAKKGAELLYNKDGWKVYKINDLDASCYYGKNTEWCISSSGDYMGDAADYWEDYMKDGYIIYFFINGYNKYALQYKNDNKYFIYDENDRLIPYIKGAPKVSGIPDVAGKITPWFMEMLSNEYNISEQDIYSLVVGDEDVEMVIEEGDGPGIYQTFWELVTASGDTYYFYIYDQTMLHDITEEVIQYKKGLSESLSNDYYRLSISDYYGDDIGGLFNAVWSIIYSAGSGEDDDISELEDLIDELQSKHTVPSKWLGEDVKFAFTTQFYNSNKNIIKRIADILEDWDYHLNITKVSPNEIVYSDGTQIAYI